MKTLMMTMTMMTLALPSARAAGTEIEPTAAFTPAYELATQAVLAHLQIPKSQLGPAADVGRKKNEEGRFADFVVSFNVDRFSRENPISQCEVAVFIAKGDYFHEGDTVLERNEDGSAKTVARLRPVRCR
jgi:hypothetical protein